MWTPEFSDFVAPARTRPHVWRVIVGTLLVGLIYFLFIMAMLIGVFVFAGQAGLAGWMSRIATGETPTAVLLLLTTFVGMAAGTFLAVRILHRRRVATLFGSGLVRGFAVAGVITALIFVVSVLALPAPFAVERNTPADIFLTFLPAAIIGILIQTGAEEVVFRGYLQQQLAARFRHPIIWLVLPSLMFGALHFDPTSAGGNAIYIAGAATVFGLVAADLTRVTGSIGAAWGVHFVNNTVAILIVALDGTLSGLSLWTLQATAADITPALIAQDVLVTIIIWLAIRLWLARAAPRSL